MPDRSLRLFPLLLAVLLLGGCGFGGFGRSLNAALLNQPDVATARTALPAFLVLNDALIESDPEDGDLLQSGALLYAFYATALVDDAARLPALAERARNYGERALCVEDDRLCGLTALAYPDLQKALAAVDRDELPALYAGALGWLVTIKARGDWTSLADLPKVEWLLERMLAVDEGYRQGSLHALLGMLKTLRPAALGGDPDGGRRHFERALALSSGRDLSVKVELAASYARAVYDRELHDRLLNEVLRSDPVAPELTLINVLAQQRAKGLLASADDYF